MEIHYDEANPLVNAIERYNGNISWIEWKEQEEAYQAYGYTYDNINRLTDLRYLAKDPLKCINIPNGAYDVNVKYADGRGNIGNIKRKGLRSVDDQGNMLFAQIDNLRMTYTNNNLTSVTENSQQDKGYQSGDGTN